jgi:uncharacterized membrane protein YhaH (DUF805 family)
MNPWFFSVLKHKYADFDGRASRMEFWMFSLFQTIVMVGVVAVLMALDTSSERSKALCGSVFMLTFVALIVPSLAVTVRRMHDIGLSGWILLLHLAPMGLGSLALFILCCIDSQRKDNRYGPNPKASA